MFLVKRLEYSMEYSSYDFSQKKPLLKHKDLPLDANPEALDLSASGRVLP